MHHVTFLLRSIDPVAPRVERVEPDAAPRPPEGARAHEDAHLAQWVIARGASVEAHYVFDDDYAKAHPEALDAAHLAMLHALITFKLFDDGDVLIPPAQLAGVLRWPAIDRARKPLVEG